MDILKLAEGYSQAVVAAVEAGEKFGKALVKLLGPVIPDLRFTLGWEEDGIEVFRVSTSTAHLVYIWPRWRCRESRRLSGGEECC